MLGDDQIDLLAEAFLAAGEALYWRVPDHWFAGGVVIVIGTAREAGGAGEADTGDAGEDGTEGPAVARREVVPPLRRWATGRLVRKEPLRWGPVWSRARDLDAGSAAAVVAGLLDVIGVLPPATQEFLIEQGVRWPNQSVRRLAISLVAERKGADAAYAIAASDPSTSVQKWARCLLQPPVRCEPEGAAPHGPEPAKIQGPEPPPTLF